MTASWGCKMKPVSIFTKGFSWKLCALSCDPRSYLLLSKLSAWEPASKWAIRVAQELVVMNHPPLTIFQKIPIGTICRTLVTAFFVSQLPFPSSDSSPSSGPCSYLMGHRWVHDYLWKQFHYFFCVCRQHCPEQLWVHQELPCMWPVSFSSWSLCKHLMLHTPKGDRLDALPFLGTLSPDFQGSQ